MKTRIIFDPKDFPGSGQMIVRESSPKGSPDIGFLTSVSYKVGYIQSAEKKQKALIALSDGMIFSFDTIEDLCLNLNNDAFGYRPLTTDEIKSIAEWQGNRFQPEEAAP